MNRLGRSGLMICSASLNTKLKGSMTAVNCSSMCRLFIETVMIASLVSGMPCLPKRYTCVKLHWDLQQGESVSKLPGGMVHEGGP